MGLNVKKNLTIEDVKARKVGLIVIMNKCIMQITSNTFIKLLIIIEDFITTLSNGL